MCTNCICDKNVSAIGFHDSRMYNYCKMIERLNIQHNTGMPKKEELFNWKEDRKRSKEE